MPKRFARAYTSILKSTMLLWLCIDCSHSLQDGNRGPASVEHLELVYDPKEEAKADDAKKFLPLFSEDPKFLGNLRSASDTPFIRSLVREASRPSPSRSELLKILGDFDSSAQGISDFLVQIQTHFAGDATRLARLQASLKEMRSLRKLPLPHLIPGAQRCLPAVLMFFAVRDWGFSARGKMKIETGTPEDIAFTKLVGTLSSGTSWFTPLACLGDALASKRDLKSWVEEFRSALKTRKGISMLQDSLKEFAADAKFLEEQRGIADLHKQLRRASSDVHFELAAELAKQEAAKGGLVRSGLESVQVMGR